MKKSIFDKNKKIIIQKIKFLEKNPEEKAFLDRTNFTPAEVIKIFKSLGYEYEFYDSNGWEQDTEYLLTNGEKNYYLFYSGYYFTMFLIKERI